MATTRECDEKFIYSGLSLEEKTAQINSIQSMLDNFLEVSRLDNNVVVCNKIALFDIVTRIDQRKKYYQYFHSEIAEDGLDIRKISQIKEIALLCYWIVKYKPYHISDEKVSSGYSDELRCTINETFASYIFISLICSYCEQNSINPDFYNSKEFKKEFIYSLAERDISKEAMILMLGSLVHHF